MALGRRRVALTLICGVVCVVGGGGAVARGGPADAAPWLIPPVDAPVHRSFVAPSGPYGVGHRGVDYAVPEGTAVRAAAPGTVAFAGRVADILAVTVDHGSGYETTYTVLSDVAVERGEHVEAGTWLGATGVAHPGGHEGLHFGLRIQERYTDPMAYLGPLDLAGAIHLAPVLERPEDLAAGSGACEPAGRPARTAAPPNDNIAVLVAGINSATRGGVAPELYALGPRLLGYPESRLYRFSYAGPAGPDLHRPYAVGDTWGGLGLAAARLRELLETIGRRHPDEGVDLIAHSQGGIVARILLQNLWAWEHDVPHIEHLVTLSTPHAGAPLSGEIAQLDDATAAGGWFVDALAAWSRRGGGVPDPRSSAVAQLAPGSGLLERLASEDIVYGTRALALTMPNDVIVPSDRARLPHEVNRVVRPEGWDGHAGSVRSLPARALVRSFLSGDPMSCSTRWDAWGPALGRVIGLAESATAEAIGAAGATMPGAGLASRTPGRSWGPAAGQKKEPPPPGGMGG